MRRIVLGIGLVAAVVLSGCQSGVALWSTCGPKGDITGTDGTYVLVCRGGSWEPIMTAKEFVAAKQGKKVTYSKLPTRPTTTTTVPAPAGAELLRTQDSETTCSPDVNLPGGGEARLCKFRAENGTELIVTNPGDDCTGGELSFAVTEFEGTMTLEADGGDIVVDLTSNNWEQGSNFTVWNNFPDGVGDVRAEITHIAFSEIPTCIQMNR